MQAFMTEIKNDETGEVVPAYMVAVDGTLKEMLDKMISLNCGFETYSDTLSKVIINGINTFFVQVNDAIRKHEEEQK